METVLFQRIKLLRNARFQACKKVKNGL